MIYSNSNIIAYLCLSFQCILVCFTFTVCILCEHFCLFYVLLWRNE